ncbi:hypothetical protein [Halobaculum rubrum]|uniref:hypothetical protein n=1 Tax=Halobaculum rubrum TaxID=2872158 RepID=UPI001CA3A50E|nr:hypothetical protein [Halobaculum rubrum]QZY00196.1 hypothetical protein K6T25_03570 [Halobaculum rubrum]
MTANFTADDKVSSIEEFEAALDEVMLTALESGIDLRGTWEYRTDEEASDVEVMIVELAA